VTGRRQLRSRAPILPVMGGGFVLSGVRDPCRQPLAARLIAQL
jgi:hypothetical protein